MKKVKLILLFMLFSAMAFCQGINKVYRSSFSIYNGYKWVEQKVVYPEALFITIKDGDIRINNNNESHFVFFGTPEKNTYETHSCHTWSCIDDEGKSCLFMIKIFRSDNTMMMSFVYGAERIMYEYVIEKK